MKAILLLTLCIAVAIADEISDLKRFYENITQHGHGPHEIRFFCNSDSDCFSNYCCIQHHPKKEGFCESLRVEGERCSEFNMCARTPSDEFCPCQESLVCKRDPDDSFSRCRKKNA